MTRTPFNSISAVHGLGVQYKVLDHLRHLYPISIDEPLKMSRFSADGVGFDLVAIAHL
tara:strand:- start:273 stop:446 length:174 start_codon:yes stop_codon:yes gene_type:complete